MGESRWVAVDRARSIRRLDSRRDIRGDGWRERQPARMGARNLSGSDVTTHGKQSRDGVGHIVRGSRSTVVPGVDPAIGPDGSLDGRKLSLGVVGDSIVRRMGLPSESFAAGPFGAVILVGSDDGRISRLQAVDVGQRCSWSIGQATDIIRRATIDPSGTSMIEMRVARTGRADLGVWRRSRRPAAERVSVSSRRRSPTSDSAAPSPLSSYGTRPARASRSSRVARSRAGRDSSILRAASSGLSMIRPLARSSASTVTRSSPTARAAGSACPVIATNVRSGSQQASSRTADPPWCSQRQAGPRLVDETSLGRERRLRATDVANGDSERSRRDTGWPGPAAHGQIAPRRPHASHPGGSSSAPDGRLPAGTSSPACAPPPCPGRADRPHRGGDPMIPARTVFTRLASPRPRAVIVLLALVGVLALALPWAAVAHDPGSGPERRVVRPGPGSPLPLALGRRSVRGHQDGDPRRRGDVTRSKNSRAATFTYDSAGANPSATGLAPRAA